jgi:hypothetical protein
LNSSQILDAIRDRVTSFSPHKIEKNRNINTKKLTTSTYPKQKNCMQFYNKERLTWDNLEMKTTLNLKHLQEKE